ncbi:cilia- and flagella-associated protein 99 isoform X1 [Hypomesus transpacificus]|uniref:cilia- and flagella-associated protein 99 isoform X1 n=2 Tax=Hypomesus transpacificus TaxID=137520 RepID=UPI001F08065C|nr:cilia- and flagella-associated protein 99 isoform X1 [Hypomesus transpacificus]XP_046904390.1 cilia- and flagella-associated protein 99 isoform X1 [Hypomesus transpacificus]XP_046904397.1 cilia- and flagella-associated protein 99 isoform X1 [Hypomesus transpacificus]
MSPNYGVLVREATLLLDKFNADKYCVEDYTEEASKSMENLEPSDKNFILDTVSGCIEHKKLTDIVVDVFYAQKGKCLLKADRNQFAVICYLAVFVLDDLGLQCFSKIVKSLDIKKMHSFLSFVFNVTNISTWIKGEWSHIYDADYVEKNWIAPLLRWHPEIEALINQLAARMSQAGHIKKAPPKITEPQEFSLTKPKHRPLPVPEPIPLQEKCHAVPTTTYRPPKEKEALEKVKQRNRQRAEQVLFEANTQQFKCANPEKSEVTKSVISQIKQSHDSQLKCDLVHSSGTPATHKTNSLPIRLNTTAILREGALYNRHVEEELNRIERLVEGAREPSAFLQWQREMREQDLQAELAQVEERRLQGRISYEEAALARARIMERNQKTALLKKEETAKLMQRYARKRLQEEQEIKELVKQVADGHKNSKAAKVKLQELKQRIAKEVSVQNRELLQQALEEAQEDLSRRLHIIREIRAFESVPHLRHTFMDETETAGHRLLGEMSLAELRERLSVLKDAEQREQEDRRERILLEKQNKEQLLLEHLDTIALHRTALGQAAERRLEEKKAGQGLQQAVAKNDKVLALQRKLEERRQERQRLKQNEKTRAKTAERAAQHALRSWNHKKLALEEKHWEALEQSLERRIKQQAPDSLSHRKILKA